MKRIRVAIKAFRLILFSKDISFSLRYNKENELKFESGCFSETSNFLEDLKKRGNFPDYILNQYKEVLNNYTY